MHVRFLPIIPQPVNRVCNYAKTLTNFQSIRQQMKQDILSIVSDEGVFRIGVDIVMNEPDAFKDLFPC